MDVFVTGNTRAVVPPIPELEEARGIERTLGRVTQVAVPIDRLGRGIGRDGVLPGAHRVGPVDLALHHVNVANFSRIHPGFSFVGRFHAQALAADLYQAAGFFRDFDHLQGLGNGVSHGLLDINVLAGLHGGDGDGRVPMVGGGDADGIDVFAVQHLTIVARGGGVRLNLLGAAEVAIVQVADD